MEVVPALHRGGCHPMTARQRDLDPPVQRRRRRWRGKRLRHHLHRQEGRRVIGDGLRPVAGITAPPEDEVGVQVVTTRNLRHRNAGRMGLRHDPALLVVLPKPVYTTRHRDPSSDGVHWPMADTIDLSNTEKLRLGTDPSQGLNGRVHTTDRRRGRLAPDRVLRDYARGLKGALTGRPSRFGPGQRLGLTRATAPRPCRP